MKIKVLEYKIHRGPRVRVLSHHTRKGKVFPNKNWDWHNKVANGEIGLMYGIVDKSVKRYSREIPYEE